MLVIKMSWGTILKMNEATMFVRDLYIKYKKVSAQFEVKMMAKTMVDSFGFTSLERIKESVRTAYQQTFLNEESIEILFKQPPLNLELKGQLDAAGLLIEDVDWLEALTPIMAMYDEIIDNLTEVDIR